MTPRTSIITDWRVRDENDLPDVPPGDEYERVIAPQKFVVLHRIRVHGMTLVSLRIGAVEAVPFGLTAADGRQRDYAPRDLDDENLRARLVATGAAVATRDSIAIMPGLEVRVVLRNDGSTTAKPRAALVVYEEIT
jgi:hypothetical protein